MGRRFRKVQRILLDLLIPHDIFLSFCVSTLGGNTQVSVGTEGQRPQTTKA